MDGPIFVLSGVPGSGKSTIAKILLQRFEFGLHIPVDDLREWVVKGIAHPVPEVTPETERQFRLARDAAAQLARVYALAGFAVAIDDVIDPKNAEERIARPLEPLRVCKILLRPSLEEALSRNANRTGKAFDTSVLETPIKRIYEQYKPKAFQTAGWLVLNTSTLTVDDSVEAILSHFTLR